MRQGFKGHRSNCPAPFEVWGVSCQAPSVRDRYADDILDHPIIPYKSGYPKDKTWPHGAVTQVDKNIIPDMHQQTVGGRPFPMYAAKVPSSYPGVACTDQPIKSSKEDNSWFAQLDNTFRHLFYTDQGTGEKRDFMSLPRNVLSTRAIYIDGEQRYLSYRCSIKADTAPQNYYAGGPLSYYFSPGSTLLCNLGSHYIIDIEDPDLISSYSVESFGGSYFFTGPITSFYNNMELNALLAFAEIPALPTGPSKYVGTYKQQSAYNHCSGREYFVYTTYSPNADYSTNGWQVARIKYQGTRTPVDTELDPAPGIEAFSSQHYNVFSDPEIMVEGWGDVGISHEGEFAIVLPSVRTYIDSSVITEANPTDECWVCAMRTYSSPKVITSQWLSKIYRSNIGSQDDRTGAADGTLSSDEVSNANIILDASSPELQALYPEEDWDNLKIRCYNRVYNARTGHSSDLLLLTTGGATVSENPPFVADFEKDDPGDPFDIDYLDHNLPEGTSFNTYGSGWDFNKWIADTDKKKNGLASAKATLNATLIGTADLELTFNPTIESQVSFWYYFDNRGAGDRFGLGTHELTNQPVVEHQLKVYLDGALATIQVDFDGQQQSGPDLVEIHGSIDNSNLKMEEESFEKWYYVTMTVPAGTHTIRWSVNRHFANDTWSHLIAHLDDISIPATMAGSDINGVKRWYFDGTRIRKAEYWAWAKRNEEGVAAPGTPDPIANRTSTVPDYITMDSEGDILYGNPHYVVKIRMDSGHEGELDETHGGPRGEGIQRGGGYARFTATPNLEPLLPPCWDPDSKWYTVDVVSDPPWGAFQILPTSVGYQVRGANAHMADATGHPIDVDYFQYIDPRTNEKTPEFFFEYLNCRISDGWNNRPHSWTITDNGKILVPHLEVIWRPTLHQMAWPEKEPWTNPPYRADFATATPGDTNMLDSYEYYVQTLAGMPGAVRFRHELALELNAKNKVKWEMKNYIVPRAYSDSYSIIPQGAWVRITDDPPPDPDPDYYLPSGTIGSANGAPWGSARWVMVQACFNPVQTSFFYYTQPDLTTAEELCPDEELPPEDQDVFGGIGRIYFWFDHYGTATDFDAIYEACDCCK